MKFYITRIKYSIKERILQEAGAGLCHLSFVPGYENIIKIGYNIITMSWQLRIEYPGALYKVK